MDSNHLQSTTTSFEGYQIPSPFSTAVDDHRERARARLPDALPVISIPDTATTTNVWGLNVDPWRNGSSTPVPSDKARGKRRAHTPDMESPRAGRDDILEDHPPNLGGAETRPPTIGVKRGRSPGTADPSREKRARLDDKHTRRKHRSRGPPKIRRPDGSSVAPHSAPVLPIIDMDTSHISMPAVSHIHSVPIPGTDQTRLDYYNVNIPDATLSFAPPQIHINNPNLPSMQDQVERATCPQCKDLSAGLQRLFLAVEEMKMAFHHMQDELHVVRAAVVPSQLGQATEHEAAAAAATENVEMRPAVEQQESEGEERLPGAYSCAPMPASVPSATEGEVNVHVARGRKVVFMLL